MARKLHRRVLSTTGLKGVKLLIFIATIVKNCQPRSIPRIGVDKQSWNFYTLEQSVSTRNFPGKGTFFCTLKTEPHTFCLRLKEFAESAITVYLKFQFCLVKLPRL